MYETPQHLIDRQAVDLKKVPRLGLGFVKRRLDETVYGRLMDHFRRNIHNFASEAANGFLQTENKRAHPTLIFQDEAFNQTILNDLHEAHEEWSGLKLNKSACYGIRVYQPGSYLYNHVDVARTHIVSSTICVDHRLSGAWPLYIEDPEGNPHEVDIEPGEMVYYEGASLKHGRPYALPGEYYANIYVHYRPADWEFGD